MERFTRLWYLPEKENHSVHMILTANKDRGLEWVLSLTVNNSDTHVGPCFRSLILTPLAYLPCMLTFFLINYFRNSHCRPGFVKCQLLPGIKYEQKSYPNHYLITSSLIFYFKVRQNKATLTCFSTLYLVFF